MYQGNEDWEFFAKIIVGSIIVTCVSLILSAFQGFGMVNSHPYWFYLLITFLPIAGLGVISVLIDGFAHESKWLFLFSLISALLLVPAFFQGKEQGGVMLLAFVNCLMLAVIFRIIEYTGRAKK